MKKSLQEILDEANAAVKAVTAAEAKDIFAAGDSVFVDLREESERQRDGMIPGSVHVPRGLLEWALELVQHIPLTPSRPASASCFTVRMGSVRR